MADLEDSFQSGTDDETKVAVEHEGLQQLRGHAAVTESNALALDESHDWRDQTSDQTNDLHEPS